MTEHRETRVALRRHPLLRRPIVWFWVLVTCYWALVWRTPVWDIDDLYFATRSGTPGGRIDWADFARLTVCDLVERNGRFSDMMVQLVMAMGGWIRVPLILSSVTASLALWLMVRGLIRDLREVVSPGADLLAGIGAFLAPIGRDWVRATYGWGYNHVHCCEHRLYVGSSARYRLYPSVVVPAGAECRPRLGFVDSGGAVMCSKHSP